VIRLDQYLVDQGYCESRSRAVAAIKQGHVRVNEITITRPAHSISDAARVDFSGPAHPYVSRGGLKLAHALEQFDLSPQGKIALDLGASTGGFTDVLLKAGAAHVYALDVGHDQLHASLSADPRVTNMEGQNARHLTADLFPISNQKPIQVLVCDVSFISLRLVVLPALALMQAPAWMIVLIKPQFEAGQAALDKNGVVQDPAIHMEVCQNFQNWFAEHAPQWQPLGLCDSPITGPQGNREFLFAAGLK